MEFDVIELTENEFNTLNSAQMRLLRTAQLKKNELLRNAGKDYEQYKAKLFGAGMKNSSLLYQKKTELDKEVKYRLEIIVDNLKFEMEKARGYGDLDVSGVGYLVDFSLSYSERFIIVRDYYLAIEDRELRMRLFSNDEVAKQYLGTYYKGLYNVLSTE